VVKITEKTGYETNVPITIHGYGVIGADFAARAGVVLKQGYEIGIRDLLKVTVGSVTVSSAALINANTYQDFVAALNADPGFSAIYEASTKSVDSWGSVNGYQTTTLIAEKTGHYTSDPINFSTTRGSGGSFGTTPVPSAGSNGAQATPGALSYVLNALTSSASNAISVLDSALAAVNLQRASYGASINQLQYAGDYLRVYTPNLQASRSHIQDADYVKMSAELSRNQIIQNAGVAMLAQANQQAHDVMALLK
jgi:flagellin